MENLRRLTRLGDAGAASHRSLSRNLLPDPPRGGISDSLHAQKTARAATAGEILSGVVWLGVFGLIILVGFSRHSWHLIAAID